jgi:hypothetical protein
MRARPARPRDIQPGEKVVVRGASVDERGKLVPPPPNRRARRQRDAAARKEKRK